MVPVLAVSAVECIAALALAGFRPARAGTGPGTELESDWRRVTIPDQGLLEKDELEAILRAAGIPYSEFLELLTKAFAEDDTAPGITASGVRPRVVIRDRECDEESDDGSEEKIA